MNWTVDKKFRGKLFSEIQFYRISISGILKVLSAKKWLFSVNYLLIGNDLMKILFSAKVIIFTQLVD